MKPSFPLPSNFRALRESTSVLSACARRIVSGLGLCCLAATAMAQMLTVSGGGTISLGQSAVIVASPNMGTATAYNLLENGVVIQSVGTFGVGGAGNDVGSPRTFTVTPPAPGSYVYTAQVALNLHRGHVDYVPSQNAVTLTVVAANKAPTIAWSSAPAAAEVGQSYLIAAQGHDDDGNLLAVSIWKNGVPFAFAGGGNGTDGSSQNTSSESIPGSVTFTAQSTDTSGATSGLISHTIGATSANRPPTISWNSNASSVASGAGYSISAHGHDPDGNLAQVNIWKNGQPFAFVGGGNGFDADSGNPTADSGPQIITFSANAVDLNGATSATITFSVTVSAPSVNRPPTITWNLAPGTVSSGQSYGVSARGSDPDGNLTHVNVWKNGLPFAFAGGGTGYENDSGNPTVDAGPATVVFTAQAVDGAGLASTTISQTVNVTSAGGVSATLSCSPDSATAPGSTIVTWSSTNATAVAVTGPGLNASTPNGSQVIGALPTGTHVFSLTAQGNGGPITRRILLSVTDPATFALTTAATAGGTVTAGGTYAAGTVVTISANSNATHRFTGWSGDVSGGVANIAVTMDRAKFAQANFIAKLPQTIDFAALGHAPPSAALVPLSASAKSGLPVTFAVLGGPANLLGGSLQLTGSGPITVQALQAGDDFYLPAPPVSQTFNATTVASLKYRPSLRTLVQNAQSRALAPLVVETP
jgi:hypothetical protein